MPVSIRCCARLTHHRCRRIGAFSATGTSVPLMRIYSSRAKALSIGAWRNSLQSIGTFEILQIALHTAIAPQLFEAVVKAL